MYPPYVQLQQVMYYSAEQRRMWIQYAANLVNSPADYLAFLHKSLPESTVITTYLCTNRSYNLNKKHQFAAELHYVTLRFNQTDCLCN